MTIRRTLMPALLASALLAALIVPLSELLARMGASAVDPTTGAIKTSDERIEQQRILAIPDRVKSLLVPTTTVAANTTSPLLKP